MTIMAERAFPRIGVKKQVQVTKASLANKLARATMSRISFASLVAIGPHAITLGNI